MSDTHSESTAGSVSEDASIAESIRKFRHGEIKPHSITPVGYLKGLYYMTPIGRATHPVEHRIMWRLWHDRPDLTPISELH